MSLTQNSTYTTGWQCTGIQFGLQFIVADHLPITASVMNPDWGIVTYYHTEHVCVAQSPNTMILIFDMCGVASWLMSHMKISVY